MRQAGCSGKIVLTVLTFDHVSLSEEQTAQLLAAALSEEADDLRFAPRPAQADPLQSLLATAERVITKMEVESCTRNETQYV